ncbi:hypothetical protein [Faecalibaculum rodentium]|uniref:hypothetical protein n=1 Tax=Faecalibaculum rodentium TaxID=1702221 RepID=UPI0025771F41|nr:hypothetical protein [Faecalibaculum rodentium]
MKQDPAVGLLVKVCDFPAMVHIASQCGMDFLFYDLEHGMISDQRLLDLIPWGTPLAFPRWSGSRSLRARIYRAPWMKEQPESWCP